MNQYFCSCCDKEFGEESTFFAIRSGKRLLYLHEECVPILSGGVEIRKVGRLCGVVVENEAIIGGGSTVIWRKPFTHTPHRIGGPSHEFADGGKYWFVDGQCHREDGPAIEYGNEDPGLWNLNGKTYTKEEHAAEMKRRKADV